MAVLQLSRKEPKPNKGKKDSQGNSPSSSTSQLIPSGSGSSISEKKGSGSGSGSENGDKAPGHKQQKDSATPAMTLAGSPGGAINAASLAANIQQQINNATSPSGSRMIAPSVIISPSSAPVRALDFAMTSWQIY